MSYSLETDHEFERLEYQSSLPQYDYRVELQELEVAPGARVLDVGSGSGIVARYLAETHPGARVVGCDLSGPRMARARAAAGTFANLEFRTEDVLQLRFADHSFDIAVCRFVLEHLEPATRPRALAEIARCLAPGGRLCVVDVDGAFTNIYPAPAPVPELVARLRADDTVDLEIGRKLPSMLLATGFVDVDTRIVPMYYRHDEVANASQIIGWTLDAAQPYLARLLGSEDRARAARQAYLDAVHSPGGIFFCHKFIVTGRRP